jgi:hypothetical protein
MTWRVFVRSILVLVVAFGGLDATAAAQQPTPGDGITRLLGQIETVVVSGDRDQYLRLLTPEADRDAAAAVAAFLTTPRPLRAAVREQERIALNAAKSRVIVNIFADFGADARLTTWSVDVRRSPADIETWQIVEQHILTTLSGLYRVSMNTAKIYAARGLSVEAEDFAVQMSDGSAFVLEAAGQPTGLVLVGKGDVTFRPSPATERGQMRIFAGAPELQTGIDGAFIRLNPADLGERVKGLDRVLADPRDVKRAEEIFREFNARSFSLDLADLSPDTWSLLPHQGDALAEIFTRRFGTLTYTRSHDEPEDITLFDRKAHRNIATYASRQRLAARGLFYDEDALADYDVIDYDVDATILPEEGQMAARARMTLEVRADNLSHLTVRLADGLRVRAVVVDDIGRVLALRVPNRNSVIVTLPSIAVRGTRLTLRFDYSGPITSLKADAEAVDAGAAQQEPQEVEERVIPIQASYLYSNRSYWYPQSTISDYATATLRIAVPARFTVVASGERMAAAEAPGTPAPDGRPMRRFGFRAANPVRYLSCIITPLVHVKTERVRTAGQASAKDHDTAAAGTQQVQVTVQANPREKTPGRALATLAADIVQFYSTLMGDYPYTSLDLALVEHELPGGHSPAYLAVINYPVQRNNITWRNDPAAVDNFREYFVAHEIAHQWWGQAVGWKNYHEQWLSEGFAQYFSALYAEHAHGSELFQDILRRWSRWAEDKSDQGPVYLGYRVGHVKGDARVFRAVVYNKGATVLHMLRRFLGDDIFFAGLRRFYREFRFRKAGTDDLQRALETEAGIPLQRFFDRWIYGDTLPRLRAQARTETSDGRQELVLRIEQAGEVFDAPVAVTLEYADRPPAALMVKVGEAQQEFRIPLSGSLRRLDLNRVDAVPLSDLVVNGPTASPAGGRPTPRPSRIR